ncbi:MAG TPA: hypothetical protein VNO30_36350 [Kofleriaceae bacterium]|nr:hypothetical protein [Kofleriaceae bacterium]
MLRTGAIGPLRWLGVTLGALGASGVSGLGGAPVARANPASLVASAIDPGDPIDLHLELDYDYSVETARIRREVLGAPVDPLDPLPDVNDLDFKQFRHRLVPRAELGILPNTSLSVALPIVIAQQRELSLAPGVTRDSSTTIADGLLPMGGFDARDPGTPLTGDAVFRGVSRSGVDQLHAGMTLALMNQDNDPSKPTWKLGGELRIPVGRVMRFDADDPSSATGVGRGIYEVRVATSVARRFGRAEGWFELYWQAPITAKRGALLDLPAAEQFGATNTAASQRGGVGAGVEVYAVEDKAGGNQISLDLGSRVDAHFEGREYSELWEVFAYAGRVGAGGAGSGPLVLDADPTTMELEARAHPGVSNVENYLELAGRAAVRARLGRYVRFAATLDFVWRTDHVISFADAGVDLPTCGAGVSGPCENETNSVVSRGTREVNPIHVDTIDLVGHRYISVNGFGFVVGVQGQILF